MNFDPTAPEPEEIVEARLVARVAAAVPHMDVLGALAPAPDGAQKLSPDTYAAVFADLTSQPLDLAGPNVPLEFSARVVVHYARADDPTGAAFRDACRAVRAALLPLLGDGCAALDGDGFACDAFLFTATETAQDTEPEEGGMMKTYTASVCGRFTAKENSNG